MKHLKGVFASLVLIINTVVLVSTLMVFALLKWLLPIPRIRVFLSRILVWIAETWVAINSHGHRWLHGPKIKLLEMPELSQDEWYLVVANHQSMTDIPILQAVFNKRIPFLKFFLKQELIWVPFLGLAWWALDFPFMRRYSREFLAKNPHLRGKDMEQTQKSCAKFKHFPTSVINFIEGTRFTPAKQAKQQSPYPHLLKPKAGGLGFVMGSMGAQMKQLLLVTVVYPDQVPSVWDYLCGDFTAALVKCEKMVIPDALLNKNYQTDEKFRTELFKWSETLWYKQNTKIQDLYERTDL
ncbi:acyltransferase [Marinicella meishanensis]|uniref:acyltransferase n=1 Tax=Marinicella meishanensis TaxID=2873263 RepID=UPI001CBDFDA4|nr:acyltransferase [Marinicella sp. NBU2979]